MTDCLQSPAAVLECCCGTVPTELPHTASLQALGWNLLNHGAESPT